MTGSLITHIKRRSPLSELDDIVNEDPESLLEADHERRTVFSHVAAGPRSTLLWFIQSLVKFSQQKAIPGHADVFGRGALVHSLDGESGNLDILLMMSPGLSTREVNRACSDGSTVMSAAVARVDMNAVCSLVADPRVDLNMAAEFPDFPGSLPLKLTPLEGLAVATSEVLQACEQACRRNGSDGSSCRHRANESALLRVIHILSRKRCVDTGRRCLTQTGGNVLSVALQVAVLHGDGNNARGWARERENMKTLYANVQTLLDTPDPVRKAKLLNMPDKNGNTPAMDALVVFGRLRFARRSPAAGGHHARCARYFNNVLLKMVLDPLYDVTIRNSTGSTVLSLAMDHLTRCVFLNTKEQILERCCSGGVKMVPAGPYPGLAAAPVASMSVHGGYPDTSHAVQSPVIECILAYHRGAPPGWAAGFMHKLLRSGADVNAPASLSFDVPIYRRGLSPLMILCRPSHRGTEGAKVATDALDAMLARVVRDRDLDASAITRDEDLVRLRSADIAHNLGSVVRLRYVLLCRQPRFAKIDDCPEFLRGFYVGICEYLPLENANDNDAVIREMATQMGRVSWGAGASASPRVCKLLNKIRDSGVRKLAFFEKRAVKGAFAQLIGYLAYRGRWYDVLSLIPTRIAKAQPGAEHDTNRAACRQPIEARYALGAVRGWAASIVCGRTTSSLTMKDAPGYTAQISSSIQVARQVAVAFFFAATNTKPGLCAPAFMGHDEVVVTILSVFIADELEGFLPGAPRFATAVSPEIASWARNRVAEIQSASTSE